MGWAGACIASTRLNFVLDNCTFFVFILHPKKGEAGGERLCGILVLLAALAGLLSTGLRSRNAGSKLPLLRFQRRRSINWMGWSSIACAWFDIFLGQKYIFHFHCASMLFGHPTSQSAALAGLVSNGVRPSNIWFGLLIARFQRRQFFGISPATPFPARFNA